MTVKEPVGQAIDEIRKAFPDIEVNVREDGEGGVYVVLETIELGEAFRPAATWVGFRITFQYPYADCYPHYVRGDLTRTSGVLLAGGGIQPGQAFENRPAIQLSRRSTRLNPQTDTALLKLEKVLLWFRSQA